METGKAWVIAVDMGYGHQRTAYPLSHLAFGGKVINANNYDGIPKRDRAIWENARKVYEFISRFKTIPLIGSFVFSVMNKLQEILSYYPKRDLSRPTMQLRQTYSLIKKGWGKHLIENLKIQNPRPTSPASELAGGRAKSKPLPIITTFFIPAFMAEFFNYPGEIFCVICDADISRVWAPLEPQKSRIRYFAPNQRVADRLELYGVTKQNVFLTGYPLPLELVGGESMEILKEDLRHRLLNLDPENRYCQKYCDLIGLHLGPLPEKSNHPLTLMFAVGGAGAQKELAIKAIKSLAIKIWAGEIKVILVAGTRDKVRQYFESNLDRLKLKNNPHVEIIFEKEIGDYFQKLSQVLRKTDILWTKPSEISFYSALGLPIIVAPPIGSQEDFNMRWLLKSGFGLFQENVKYANQWLFDWLAQGYLAEAAMEGFIEGEKLGTLKIEKICFG